MFSRLPSQLVLGLVHLVGAAALAGESPVSVASHCADSNIRNIERPIRSSGGPETFEYRYRVSPGDDHGPVVIFIPGGPGQTSFDMALGYPPEFTVVRTDPRGVGCNQSPKLSNEDLRSEEIARDILAIVRHLKPSSYILHGVSYGTVVATQAAAMAESESVPPPIAVVLEGTMGRAFRAGEYSEGYLRRWQALKSRVSPETARQLSSDSLPFGLTSREWAAWLSSSLIYGVMPSGYDYTLDELSRLDASNSVRDREAFGSLLKKMSAPSSDAKARIYRQIVCRELVPDVQDVKFDFDLIKGDLVLSGQKFCAGTPFDRPYDSARFQVKQSAIYYFAGYDDPATPVEHARYHCRAQKADRHFIGLEQGGHQVLSGNLADCGQAVWRGIFKGGTAALRSAFKECIAEPRLRFETCEQESQ